MAVANPIALPCLGEVISLSKEFNSPEFHYVERHLGEVVAVILSLPTVDVHPCVLLRLADGSLSDWFSIREYAIEAGSL